MAQYLQYNYALKNKINIEKNLIAELSKRRGIETSAYASGITVTAIDKCFTRNLATLKEESFINSVAASTRIEGSTIGNDGVRQIIIKERFASIASQLTSKDEQRVTLWLAYKPGVTIAEMLNCSPATYTLEFLSTVVTNMLNRGLIAKSGQGYKINS